MTGLPARLAPPEEGFERFVHPMQHLRVDRFVLWSHHFDLWQLGALLGEADRLATHPIGIAPFLERSVIQLATEGKLRVQDVLLLFRWIDAIAIGFLHREIFFFSAAKAAMGTRLKPAHASPLPFKWRGLWRAKVPFCHQPPPAVTLRKG